MIREICLQSLVDETIFDGFMGIPLIDELAVTLFACMVRSEDLTVGTGSRSTTAGASIFTVASWRFPAAAMSLVFSGSLAEYFLGRYHVTI